MQTATPLDVALARARVLLVGVGGLGAPAAAALAAAGVGVLGLIDPDVVELSNLHRQPLYESGDLGRPKVDVAAARLRARTPQLRVETWRTRFGPDHGELARSFDVVLGKWAATSLAGFYGLLAVLPSLGIPVLLGGVTPGEYGRTALAVVNAILFSLTAGMLVSALNRDHTKTILGSLILVLALSGLLPGLMVLLFKGFWGRGIDGFPPVALQPQNHSSSVFSAVNSIGVMPVSLCEPSQKGWLLLRPQAHQK